MGLRWRGAAQMQATATLALLEVLECSIEPRRVSLLE